MAEQLEVYSTRILTVYLNVEINLYRQSSISLHNALVLLDSNKIVCTIFSSLEKYRRR